ncbi:P-loop containing nucleoside triphosphate hydrolase protein [Paraphysoderma sedebokerense]|nr:P-loop containing nucleoside triphosphate hydrolase protein [Paraphysoderma sedebokerense]
MNSFDAPPSVISLLQSLQGEGFYKNQIVDIETQAARAANYSDGTDLEPKLKSFLSKAKNINMLFSHQAEALNEIASGNHVVLATPTSSGKSLAYQLPILSRLERDKSAAFLYICPTKALAQDQYRSWKDFFKGTDYDWAELATYDGDTDQSIRSNIREFGNVILTNPDMLHVSILPNHYLWSRFLENLKIVVVDELHSYHGVFGSHCALIFRRLRRLCEHYGNRSVQFFACSATISNPVEHGTKMFGLSNDQLKIVDKDGSPGGQRSYIFWNPPYVNPRDPSLGRVNSLSEAANLFLFFVKRNVKTVVFARHRKGCELLFKDVTTTILSTSSTATSSNTASNRSLIHLLSKIKSYRGGYRKDERRNIEQGLFSGQLLGVVATNALELGIDIGGIDCVIHLGFPGVNAMHQQAGRAGRRGRDSLSILVADSNPLDQYYMKNPKKLFVNGLEDVAISPENLLLLESHLRCAAFELPITTETDVRLFGSSIYEICQKSLKKQDDLNVYTTDEVNPALQIPIRAIEQDLYSVYDVTNNQRCLMEEIESSRAAFSLYIGGIYLHQGKSYLILDVNTEHRFAKVKYTNVEWITMCRDYTDVDPVRPLETRKLRGEAFAGYGDIKTITKVFAYHQIDPRKQSIIDRHEIDTPPIIRLSKGAWVDIGIDTVRFVESKTDDSIYAALHSVAHTILSLAPMIVVGMSDDCYTECVSPDARRHRPFRRLIFGDARCGGTGLSKKLYDHIELLLDKAYEVIFNCGCPEGCPECSYSCRENNVVVSKLGALSILSHVLGKEQTGPESRSTRLDSPKITEDGEKIIVTPSGTKVYVGNKNRQGQKNVYTELGRIIKSSKMEDFEGEDFKVE